MRILRLLFLQLQSGTGNNWDMFSFSFPTMILRMIRQFLSFTPGKLGGATLPPALFARGLVRHPPGPPRHPRHRALGHDLGLLHSGSRPRGRSVQMVRFCFSQVLFLTKIAEVYYPVWIAPMMMTNHVHRHQFYSLCSAISLVQTEV